jgi:hypothetical protein
MDIANYWSSNGLSIETPSSNELALHFEELSPTHIHIGTDDMISEGKWEGQILPVFLRVTYDSPQQFPLKHASGSSPKADNSRFPRLFACL